MKKFDRKDKIVYYRSILGSQPEIEQSKGSSEDFLANFNMQKSSNTVNDIEIIQIQL